MDEMLVFSDIHANDPRLKESISITVRTLCVFFCSNVWGYRVDIQSSIVFVGNNVDLAVAGSW
jgi:hypothetical protein